jgi:hypothetical protein
MGRTIAAERALRRTDWRSMVNVRAGERRGNQGKSKVIDYKGQLRYSWRMEVVVEVKIGAFREIGPLEVES